MYKLEDYLKMPYTRETIQDEDGSFFIRIKELDGCMSCGDTIEEAYENIKEAMQLWIEVNIEDGVDIPFPDSMSEKEYSGKLNVRMSRSLHAKLSRQAKTNSVSLNAFIVEKLATESSIQEAKDEIMKSVCRMNDHVIFNYTGKFGDAEQFLFEEPQIDFVRSGS
jgi:antitoxin HicB